jgi:hypothetical protein
MVGTQELPINIYDERIRLQMHIMRNKAIRRTRDEIKERTKYFNQRRKKVQRK